MPLVSRGSITRARFEPEAVFSHPGAHAPPLA